MLEQVSNSITYYAFFAASGVGATGLTVTVDIYNPAHSETVTGGSATELGDGLYYYTLASGSTGSTGVYPAVFKTSGTADQQHVPAVWVVGTAGIEHLDSDISDTATATALQTVDNNVDSIKSTVDTNLDVTVSSRLATTGYTAPDNSTIATINTNINTIDNIVDAILIDTNELQLNQGNWLTATGFSTHSAADVWAVGTRSLTDKANFTLTVAYDSAKTAASQTSVDTIDGIVDNILLDTAEIANLDTKINTIDSVVDAILIDTNELQTNQGNWLTATGFSTFNAAVDSVIVGTNNDKTDYVLTADYDSAKTAASQGSVDTIDTNIDSIKSTVDTNLNATISSRSSHSAADVWSVTTRTLSSFGSLVSDIASAVWSATTRTLSAFGFSVTVGTNNDKTDYALTSAYDSAKTAATQTSVDTIDGIVDSIKLLTDKLNAMLENTGTYDRFIATALEESPTGSGSGASAAEVWAYGSRELSTPANYKADLTTVLSNLSTLLSRLSAERAVNLDDLDVPISTRLAGDVYTNPDNTNIGIIASRLTAPRAANLDNLNTTISSRASQTSVDSVQTSVDAIEGQTTNIYNNTQIIVGGDGTLKVSIQFYLDGTTTALSDVITSAYYTGGSPEVMKASGISDVNGQLDLLLDNGGPYEIRARKAGYTIAIYNIADLQADNSITIYAGESSLISPTNPGECVIYENVKGYNSDSTPENTVMTARISSLPFDYGGALYEGIEVTSTYDALEQRTSFQFPYGCELIVNFRYHGIKNKKIIVPSSDSARLADITEVS